MYHEQKGLLERLWDWLRDLLVGPGGALPRWSIWVAVASSGRRRARPRSLAARRAPDDGPPPRRRPRRARPAPRPSTAPRPPGRSTPATPRPRSSRATARSPAPRSSAPSSTTCPAAPPTRWRSARPRLPGIRRVPRHGRRHLRRRALRPARRASRVGPRRHRARRRAGADPPGPPRPGRPGGCAMSAIAAARAGRRARGQAPAGAGEPGAAHRGLRRPWSSARHRPPVVSRPVRAAPHGAARPRGHRPRGRPGARRGAARPGRRGRRRPLDRRARGRRRRTAGPPCSSATPPTSARGHRPARRRRAASGRLVRRRGRHRAAATSSACRWRASAAAAPTSWPGATTPTVARPSDVVRRGTPRYLPTDAAGGATGASCCRHRTDRPTSPTPTPRRLGPGRARRHRGPPRTVRRRLRLGVGQRGRSATRATPAPPCASSARRPGWSGTSPATSDAHGPRARRERTPPASRRSGRCGPRRPSPCCRRRRAPRAGARRRLGRLVREPLPVVVRAVETTERRGRLYRRAGDRARAAAVLRLAPADRLARRLAVRRGAGPSPSSTRRRGRPAARPRRWLASCSDPPRPTTPP